MPTCLLFFSAPDSTVYDSALSLNGSTTDLRSEDRMSRGRSSFDSTTDYHSKRYGSNRDLSSIGRRNSALTNGQRSILSREASPKLSSISSRANSLRSIYSPEPVTQNHSFSSRETSIEPRSGLLSISFQQFFLFPLVVSFTNKQSVGFFFFFSIIMIQSGDIVGILRC